MPHMGQPGPSYSMGRPRHAAPTAGPLMPAPSSAEEFRVECNMSRIRVVRVIARLNVGGPALHATLLTERLDRTRYDSLLVAGSEGPQEGNYLALHGRAVEPLVTLPTLGREVRGAQDLFTLGRL